VNVLEHLRRFDPEASERERLEQLLKIAEFTPNPNQRSAIEHTTGPLFLVAGPGSGKTRVLLWRTVNLIAFHGVDPGEVFLGTFTEKAAKQLRDGILSLLGMVTHLTGDPYDISNMYVGTVHSLCLRILQDRSLVPGRGRREVPKVLDELDQYFTVYSNRFWRAAQEEVALGDSQEAFFERVNELFGGRFASKHRAVLHLISLFNRFSEENLPLEQLRQQAHDDGMRLLVDLYGFYVRYCGPARDLSRLQGEGLHRLHGNGGSGVFRHVIVDEYQDTNAVQEDLFFHLAGERGNLCVVGDDDQALYRFRGATVENFVQFPDRCHSRLGVAPTRIELNTNYRSRDSIVDFYGRFMDAFDWRRPGYGHYRLTDKRVRAHRGDGSPAVVATTRSSAEATSDEIADLVVRLLQEGKVEDPNQIAFLFPSLKSRPVQRLSRALEARGLKVYAPRARRFLETDEATAVFGLFARVFGRPPSDPAFFRGDYAEFHRWLDDAERTAKRACREDALLADFLGARRAEVERSVADHLVLSDVLSTQGWDVDEPYDPARHRRALATASGLSDRARTALGNRFLDKVAREKLEKGSAFRLRYVVGRASALDWSLLDLFFRLMGFDRFKGMFDLAESGEDEGPVANLALTSQILSRFLDQNQSILTGAFLHADRFRNVFFGSFLFALWRLAEGEYEDAEDPFPKGRIPFLTIHQAKGLEFPIVVLGSPRKDDRGPQAVERLIRPFLDDRDPEPLDRVSGFDIMRMFYVALSRAQNLLIIAHPRGRGIQTHPQLDEVLDDQAVRIPDLDLATVPSARGEVDDVVRTYSYTGDYQAFLRCPRAYMIFRRYGFAPSRTQTMFFGSLVHQTIEDLHHRLISLREAP
jgi:DNA helicase-2/ATP-dependent DNA helicase PcrA